MISMVQVIVYRITDLGNPFYSANFQEHECASSNLADAASFAAQINSNANLFARVQVQCFTGEALPPHISKMDMHNSIIGSLENVRIHSLDNYLFIEGRLSVNAGGLIHVQNLISTFGGTLSVVAWRIESLDMDMAFMAVTIDNYDIGLNMRVSIDITPEMAAQQIEAWKGNDIMKCKRKCNLTLIDNSYLVPSSDESNYEWQKKSMVN